MKKYSWIIVAIILISALVFFFSKQESQENVGPVDVSVPVPLTFNAEDANISVKVASEPFTYSIEELGSMAAECGNQVDDGYVATLVDLFEGVDKTVYSFSYTGESQDPDTFFVTLLPNLPEYDSLEAFKKDFDICSAGGEAYPHMVDDAWLLFVSSCGSGFGDGSGNVVGCQYAKDIIEPTLTLN